MTDSVDLDYRYECACGQAGVWQPTVNAARWLGQKHVVRRGEGHSIQVYQRVRVAGEQMVSLA